MDEVLYPVGATAALLALFCVAGWAGNHADDIAASWHEGRAQVVVWAHVVVAYALLLTAAGHVRRGGA